MKVFTTTDFKGHYPVGTAAVVVARDRGHARRLLLKELESRGLKQNEEIEFDKLDLDTPGVVVLRDGDY